MTNCEHYGQMNKDPESGDCDIIDFGLWRSRKGARAYLDQFEESVPEQKFRLHLMYDQAAADQQQFFTSGHQPPEHGDISY